MAQVHGGKLVAQALRRRGVQSVFTLCGAHIQAIYDGCLDEGIRVIDVRHEATAGHAADAMARVTGRAGVALVTAGAGVTNVVTALANAQRAGVPVVCIGGAGPLAMADMGSPQEMNSVELLRPVTKWSVRVNETERIGEYVDAAFRVAHSNTPGVVYVELPLDVLMGLAEDDAKAPMRMNAPRPAGEPASISAVAELIQAAGRPTLLVGSQLRFSPAHDALARFSEKVQIPVFLNGMARGALPIGHPNLFSRTRRMALKESDLIVVMGTPFDFRVDYGRKGSWNPDARIVQVDLDGAELGRNRDVDVAIQADTGLVLQQLTSAVPEKRCPQWTARLREQEQEQQEAERAAGKNDDRPGPLCVCQELTSRLSKDDIVIGDGGDFVATVAHNIGLQWPQIWMDPGPLGTLGVGPGYGIGARVSRPNAKIVVLFGDGAFGLHAMEFEAMARQKIPIIAIIGNDAAWTQTRRGQIELYGEERAIATKLAFTRYDLVVGALGGKGYFVETAAQLGQALDQAFEAEVPVCINVKLSSSRVIENDV